MRDKMERPSGLISCNAEDGILDEEVDLVEQVEQVGSEADFVAFLCDLRDDYLDNPEQWQNASLEAFLDALVTCAAEISLHRRPVDENLLDALGSSWKMFAQILLAAKYYPESVE
jgi:hypothetical protein